MGKKTDALEMPVRNEFVTQGCKRAGHIEFITSADKSIYVYFFTMAFPKKGIVRTSIGLRYTILNNLSFYISEYGTEYKGKILKGPFRNDVSIPNSLHVSGAASFSIVEAGSTKIYDGKDVGSFVKDCIAEGRQLLGEYQDMNAVLRRSLDLDIARDHKILIAILLEDYKIAREMIEESREPDGVFLWLVPKKADQYLSDIGY